MSEYNQTLDDNMLRDMNDVCPDEMVVASLMKYYDVCIDNYDKTILEAIERVLERYMSHSDFNSWVSTRGK